MELREIAAKARLVSIIARRRISRFLYPGEFSSLAKAGGLEFNEVRPYSWGDDPRYMDWNVSAKMGQPYVKVFETSREQQVLLALDVSASMRKGPIGTTILKVQREISAILSTSAYFSQNRVGILIFTDRIEYFLPPGRGKHRLQQIFQAIEGHEPQGQKTDFYHALNFVARRIRRGTIIYLLSDFSDFKSADNSALIGVGKSHELIGIRISNPLVREIPNSGLWRVCHPETGAETWLDFGSSKVREAYLKQLDAQENEVKTAFRRSGQRIVEVSTHGDWLHQLKKQL